MQHWIVKGAGYLLLTISVLLSPVTSASDKIRIGWVYAMANAPAIIAEQQGLYAKFGVDVDLRPFNSGPLVLRALEAGDLDMAYVGMPPVFRAFDEGLAIKIVSKVNYGQAAMFVSHDSDIKTLADLKHKRIASVRRGSGMDILLRGYVLKEAGLDPQRDVNIITMPSKIMHASVQRGLVDAAFTWEPYVSQAVITDNARVILDINEKFPHYPWYVLVATEHMLNARRGSMLNVLRAHTHAIRYLNQSPDAGAAFLVERFRLQNVIDATGAQKSATDIVLQARTRLGWECEFRKTDIQFVQRLINYSSELGYLKQTINAEDLFDRETIESLKLCNH